MKIKFSYIMLILALSVAGCAAYFSVWGLSQLFAGASTAVIIMASVLEIGKVVTTTALHTYWHKLARGLKIYLTISVGVLMIITSAGIYGFLSNAYQSTANKLELHEGELGVLEAKKQVFEKTIADNTKIIETKTKRAEQLNNLRGNQESRLDNSTNNRNQRNARKDIESSDKQIQVLNTEIDALNAKNIVLSDSVNVYNVKAIELKAGSEVAGEVGPLKYVSELTGTPMANVVNYMILLLIFVFDPLAIALVLATNRVFELEGRQTPLEPKKPDYTPSGETPTTIVEVIKANSEGVTEGASEGVTEGVTEGIKVDEETGEFDLSGVSLPIPEDVWSPIEEPILEDEQHDDAVSDAVSDAVNEIEPWDIRPIPEEIAEEPSTTVSEKSVEVPVYKKQPVVTTGKVNLEDIKEIKEGRGFSVDIPNPKTNNTIERIGSNKIVKNGDNNKVYFKRG
jgi:hypothetical protein